MKVIVLGRSQNNDIVITDPYVSRTHAQIVFHDDGKIGVLDLGSKTGTFVNGQKIHSEVFIKPGDMIKVGNTIVPWENYISSDFSEPIPENENFNEEMEDEKFPEEISKFAKYKKAIVFSLAFLLILGGGYFGYEKGWFDKIINNDKEVTEDNTKEDKDDQKNPENELEAVSGDGYYLMVPPGFEDVEDADADADIQYVDKKNKIYLKVIVKPVEELEKDKKLKRNKKKDLFNKFREADIKAFSAKKKEYKQKREKTIKLDGLDAVKYTFHTKENKKNAYGERIYVKGDDNYYIIYIYTLASKVKQKKKSKKIMKDIINSFKIGSYDEEDDDEGVDEDSDDNGSGNNGDDDDDEDDGDNDE